MHISAYFLKQSAYLEIRAVYCVFDICIYAYLCILEPGLIAKFMHMSLRLTLELFGNERGLKTRQLKSLNSQPIVGAFPL